MGASALAAFESCNLLGADGPEIGAAQALLQPQAHQRSTEAIVLLDQTGQRFEWARIGLGPVAPVPFRASGTEAFLAGQPAVEETYLRAAQIAAGEAQPRSSVLRASREYRLEVLQVLVRRGLARAVAQAQERGA